MFDRLAIDYIATSADTDETVLDQVSPAEYVKILAKRKGEAEGIPLWKFLKGPMVRKFGEDWYQRLEKIIIKGEVR